MRNATTAWNLIAGGAVALALALPTGIARAEEPSKPKLVGRWQLNQELSDDARAKLAEMRERRGRPGGGEMGGAPGGAGMGGRPGGMGGRPGGGRSGERPGGRRDGQRPDAPGATRMRALLEPPRILTITGNDAELTFDTGEDVLVRLHVDGRRYKQEGGSLETRAQWRDAELVVETKPTQGRGKTTTSYSLEPGSGRLQIVTKLDSPMGGDPVSLKRVYDPAPLE